MLTHPHIEIETDDDWVILHFCGGYMAIDTQAFLTVKLAVPRMNFKMENMDRYRELAEESLDEAVIAFEKGVPYEPRQVDFNENRDKGPLH